MFRDVSEYLGGLLDLEGPCEGPLKDDMWTKNVKPLLLGEVLESIAEAWLIEQLSLPVEEIEKLGPCHVLVPGSIGHGAMLQP
jgi:hypothetical protein